MLFWFVIVQKQTPHDIYISYYSQQRNPAFLEVTIEKLGIPSGSVPFLKGTELRNQRRWSVIRAEHSIFTSYLLNNVIKYKHSSYQCVPGSKPDGSVDTSRRLESLESRRTFTFFFLFEMYILVKHVLSCIMEKQSDFGVFYLVQSKRFHVH